MSPENEKRKTIRFKNASSSGRAKTRKPSKDPARPLDLDSGTAGEPASGSETPQRSVRPMTDRSLEIRERAYLIFESSGRQHGHDLDHWLEAERQVAITEPSEARSE